MLIELQGIDSHEAPSQAQKQAELQEIEVNGGKSSGTIQWLVNRIGIEQAQLV